MLVVNRVELAVIDQVPQVRRLDDGDTSVLEHDANAVHHATQVRDVREHVVRVDDVGADAFCRD